MTCTVINMNGTTILELASGGGLVQSERDALDLVSACGEHDCSKLLIDAACFSEDFFRLRTGLAGAVLQKFTNYRIQAAVVAPPGAASQGKFRDFMLETNRGNQFRIVEDREAALGWLTGK
jgi:PadR family transcriptional regulator, regulatory protein AphA